MFLGTSAETIYCMYVVSRGCIDTHSNLFFYYQFLVPGFDAVIPNIAANPGIQRSLSIQYIKQKKKL